MKTVQQLKRNVTGKSVEKGGTVPELDLVEKELYNILGDSKGTIREMCCHILGAGGKRVRPLLTVYWGQVFSCFSSELLTAAVAAELIHMASLVHDDIIDNSGLRRSKPSVNSIWGSHFAVLCGDYLFAKAFGILSGRGLFTSLNHMVEAIESMCSGEIIQASCRFKPELSIKEYYNLIAMKTAIFTGCCCKSGAAAGGASGLELKLAYNYGLHLGYAYQIVDDVLDFYGEVEKMGKPKYEDLRQGSITLPVIFLLRDERFGSWTRELIQSRELSADKLDMVAERLVETGLSDKCMKIAGLHIEKAKRFASMFSGSRYSKELIQLADKLLLRVR